MAGALVALGGCSAVGPSVVAQVAATSTSVATTGKGVSDNVLSMAMDKDCLVSRGVRFQPICKPKGDGPSDATLADAVDEPAVSSLGAFYSPAAPSAGAASPAVEPYFLIASFENRADASHVALSLAAPPATVAETRRDGAPYYRVVVGPARADTAPRLRRQLASAGLTPRRTVMLCRDSLVEPPCAPAPVPEDGAVVAER